MSAGVYSFTIEQGDDFSRVLTWKDGSGNPINLSGYTAACQVRARNGMLLIDFSNNGTLSIDGTAGTVTMSLPASFTGTLDFDTADYDLKLTSGTGGKTRLIKGVVTLSPEVTE